MSFLDSIFHQDKLSDLGQIKYDLAQIHLEKGQLLEASSAIQEAKESDPDSEKVKALALEIETALQENGGEKTIQEEEQLMSSEEENEELADWFIYRTTEFDQELVQQYTEQGYEIESVACGNEWVIVFRMAENGENQQSYLLVEEFGEETFKEHFESGYYITKGASDGTNWLFVMESREDWVDQYWLFNPTAFPKDQLEEWEKENCLINLVIELGDVYFVCAAVLKDTSRAIISNKTDEKPSELVSHIWNNDQWLIRIFFFQDYYFLYQSEDVEIDDQSFIGGDIFPESELNEYMAEGYRVSQMCYGSEGWCVLTEKKK